MKKHLRKRTVILIFTFVLLILCGMTAGAGFRKMPNGRYRYYTSKKNYYRGSVLKTAQHSHGHLCGVFKNIKKNGKAYTYCFDENGYMLTGWQFLYVKDKTGTMRLGCYYFNKNGQMYKNCSTGGRFLNGSGRLLNNHAAAYSPYSGRQEKLYFGMDGYETAAPAGKAGFVTDKKGTKYRKEDGTFAGKGWLCIRENAESPYYWYYFYSSGDMAKSKQIGSRYVGADGRLQEK